MSECHCYECNKDVMINIEPGFTVLSAKMIICPTCGNKRCPHATDHRLACSGSNESGQLGSRYGEYPHPALPLVEFLNSKK
jgi:hypothetical protein